MRGRSKKPTKLHHIDGTFRADRANPNEPIVAPEIPECPEFLGDTAAKAYEKITKHLHGLGLIGQIDQALLTCFAQAWADIEQATQELEQDGYTVEAGDGTLKNHPALRRRLDAQAMLIKIAPHFGLSPSARARLNAPPKDDVDPLDELLNRGKNKTG